jgi:basic membrane protein A
MTISTAPRGQHVRRAVAALALVALIAAGCGDDDSGGDDSGDSVTSEETEETEAAAATETPTVSEAPEETESPAASESPAETQAPAETDSEMTGGSAEAAGGDGTDLDTNGDGVVVLSVATPGPRDDGGFYQALVEGVEEFSAANGYEEPIIVDNIDPAQAETELRNLARQDVDMIAVGAGEISDPLEGLVAEFPDIFWYCNCGTGVEVEGVTQASDDSSQISYTAGYATGLLLQDTDSTNAAFLGCCDLDFEREAFMAFELGLQAVDPGFTATYVPTGDFDDVAGATEAFNQAVAAGAGAVYPFLGGAQEAVVGLANEAGIITMSPGPAGACERTDLDYQIAVQFDAADYFTALLEMLASGEVEPGDTVVFEVGQYDFVGAKFCDGATDEQIAALDEVNAQIAAGELTDAFDEIKSEAYGF